LAKVSFVAVGGGGHLTSNVGHLTQGAGGLIKCGAKAVSSGAVAATTSAVVDTVEGKAIDVNRLGVSAATAAGVSLGSSAVRNRKYNQDRNHNDSKHEASATAEEIAMATEGLLGPSEPFPMHQGIGQEPLLLFGNNNGPPPTGVRCFQPDMSKASTVRLIPIKDLQHVKRDLPIDRGRYIDTSINLL
jgi:hypothetical protein